MKYLIQVLFTFLLLFSPKTAGAQVLVTVNVGFTEMARQVLGVDARETKLLVEKELSKNPGISVIQGSDSRKAGAFIFVTVDLAYGRKQAVMSGVVLSKPNPDTLSWGCEGFDSNCTDIINKNLGKFQIGSFSGCVLLTAPLNETKKLSVAMGHTLMYYFEPRK